MCISHDMFLAACEACAVYGITWCMLAPCKLTGEAPRGLTYSCSSAYASGMDAWHLTAAEHLASSCRSVLLALAVLHVRISYLTPLHCLPTVIAELLCGLYSNVWQS